MKVELFSRWYDMWIGFYIDKEAMTLYFCPVPMIGLKIKLPRRHYLIWGQYYKKKINWKYMNNEELTAIYKILQAAQKRVQGEIARGEKNYE